MLKKLLIIPGVALGVVLLVYLAKSREGPQKIPVTERQTQVRFIEVMQVDLVPRARGYGYVQPDSVWNAVAEVGGKIVKIHSHMKKGTFVGSGEMLFTIEPTQSQLVKEEVEAEILKVEAQIKELDQKEKDTRRLLEIEKSTLVINQEELKRKEQLYREGIISKSEYDREKRNLLVQINSVESFKGTLNRIPAERRAYEATIAAYRSRLGEAHLNLEKTIIRAPFDGRVAEVHVELGQAAKIGEVLAVLDSTGIAEVSAQVPKHAFKNLIPKNQGRPIRMEDFRGLSRGDAHNFLGLKAIIRVELQGKPIEWRARFSRISETDPKTGTLGVYVAVDDPYLKTRPGERPPLDKNMYCEVELLGRPQKQKIIVPRSALHEETLYIITAENRLEKRPVEVEFFQDDLVVIQSGVASGEKVIVSDVIPAIEGMLLNPHHDQHFQESLHGQATRVGAGT